MEVFEIFGTIFGVCSVSLIFLGVPFGFAAYVRRLRHKEILEMAERGLVKVPQTRNGKDTLRWGIVITALGIALCLGLYPIGWALNTGFPLEFGPWMLIGLLPTFFGIALIAIYLTTREKEDAKEESEVMEMEE
ncbi:MAG: hypothetical protein JXB38_21555 [Anaerolineales bacterium]|nr:hypothetical protein [Anaerolineales bacterium]